jgi:hypothetical protein
MRSAQARPYCSATAWARSATLHPGIDHVGPLLQHVAPLLGVLGLVVDRARGTAVFMRQALLDPVAVEADLVEQRRAGAAQVVHRERF